MSYLLTSAVQISTADSTVSQQSNAVDYTARLTSVQTVATPLRQRYTVGSTAVQLSLISQVLQGGSYPVVSAGGSVPRVRLINTSNTGSVNLVCASFVNLPTGPTTTTVEYLIGPGFITDIAMPQMQYGLFSLAPADTSWAGVVPASSGSPVVVDVLFL